jgi:hypothetical protein
MSKFVCTPCAPLSQMIECRAISDEHLPAQGFAVVRLLNGSAVLPGIQAHSLKFSNVEATSPLLGITKKGDSR